MNELFISLSLGCSFRSFKGIPFIAKYEIATQYLSSICYLWGFSIKFILTYLPKTISGAILNTYALFVEESPS